MRALCVTLRQPFLEMTYTGHRLLHDACTHESHLQEQEIGLKAEVSCSAQHKLKAIKLVSSTCRIGNYASKYTEAQ